MSFKPPLFIYLKDPFSGKDFKILVIFSGQFCLGPKKSELKVGESSAFFLYVKSSKLENNSQGVAHDESTAQHSRMEENIQTWGEQMSNNIQVLETGEKYENYSQGDNSLVVVVSPILFLWRGLVAPLCHWNFHNKVSLRRKSALRCL